MKSTGMIRKIDELGRIVLPMEIRKNLNINVKDPLEIYVEGNDIILRKFRDSCILCGERKNLVLFEQTKICKECINSIKEF